MKSLTLLLIYPSNILKRPIVVLTFIYKRLIILKYFPILITRRRALSTILPPLLYVILNILRLVVIISIISIVLR